MTDRPVFYFDLGSPFAYLAAERINPTFAEAVGEPPVWEPVLLGGLFKRFGRDSWANGPDRADGIAEVERRAGERGLPPLRWPDPFPGNTLFAMRVATYAKQIGRTVSFSLAAFRQAFAAGRDLSDPDSVLVAAAAAEMHPRAVTAAVERDSVKSALRGATERAGDLGVRGVPSLMVGDQVFWGDDRLERAAEAARS
ncbi:MAG TPA: DsbA family protein [Solirubrobacterales bacterium]|jgi:2-hydroxychromene-2-carboxylate isomerase|nr:DsbA family protein [Solirubrobacterales bacterium]